MILFILLAIQAWQWQCGAAGIFFSWMGLLLFIQNVPKLGIYVLMFTHVLQSFFSFFGVFFLFVIGFAFSFHVLLQNRVNRIISVFYLNYDYQIVSAYIVRGLYSMNSEKQSSIFHINIFASAPINENDIIMQKKKEEATKRCSVHHIKIYM